MLITALGIFVTALRIFEIFWWTCVLLCNHFGFFVIYDATTRKRHWIYMNFKEFRWISIPAQVGALGLEIAPILRFPPKLCEGMWFISRFGFWPDIDLIEILRKWMKFVWCGFLEATAPNSKLEALAPLWLLQSMQADFEEPQIWLEALAPFKSPWLLLGPPD